MRLYTNGYYNPGTFGLKQKTGNNIIVKITNNLSGKNCNCVDCKCFDNSQCKDSNKCTCIDCKCKCSNKCNCIDCKCFDNYKCNDKKTDCCGNIIDGIQPSCCIPDDYMPTSDNMVISMDNMYESDPCRWRLHFHGFWGPGHEDNYRKAIDVGQDYTFTYKIDKNHSIGLFIAHNHNYTTAESQVSFSSFPIKLYNDQNEFPSIKDENKIELFIQQLYMVPSSDPTVEQNTGSDYEIFNFYYWNKQSDFNTAIAKSTKFILVNGSIEPYLYLPINELCLLDIAWFGIDDTCRLTILDDINNPIEYRIVKIDCLPIPSNKKMFVKNFLLAHLQRITISFLLPKYGQYRVMKCPTKEEASGSFSAGTKLMFFINGFLAKNSCQNILSDLQYININLDYWQNIANKYFRNLNNVIAYRNMLFNFPNMGGQIMNNDYKQIQMIKDRSEIWIVGSEDGGTHSYHIHLMNFLIIAWRNGSQKWKRIEREQQHFQDTLIIKPNIQFLVWNFPIKYTGKAMTHCHLLRHESNAMMLNLYISPNKNDKASGVGIFDPTPEIISIVKQSSIGDFKN